MPSMWDFDSAIRTENEIATFMTTLPTEVADHARRARVAKFAWLQCLASAYWLRGNATCEAGTYKSGRDLVLLRSALVFQLPDA